MSLRILVAMFTVGAMLGVPVAQALDVPGPLVSPQWLEQHRNEVNIIDVRDELASFGKAPVFATEDGKKVLTTFGGHIPGARLLDFNAVRVTRAIDGHEWKWMLPDQAAFQALMRQTGVMQGRPTIIVSDGAAGADLDMAARVFWSMQVYGGRDLAILDGGTTAWLEAGLPFSTDAAKGGAGNWIAAAENRKLFADSNDVAKAAAHGKQLVDARPMPFYVGLERKPIVLAAGHIAGAVNFPPDVRAGKRGGSAHFLDAAQYAAVFKHLGVDPQKPSITYCNTGHLASGAWFVLSQIMKNPNVGLYDGSMYEWTAEQRPVVGLP
ncbi:MAG: sulfurtransferase [Proteobacteria bacterium]|nr:sulfurtransferase [Pseudomonadota bacterium]